jgi:exodeoxyribonuclease-3
MRILSWNVNGLRAAAKKGFADWLAGSGADIVALQEVRARPEQLPPEVAEPEGWSTHFVAAEKPGYSGVGLLSTSPPDSVETSLGASKFDAEGRLQLARFGDLLVVNGYFPNGNGTALPNGKRSNNRVPYKLAFYRALFDRLEADRAAGRPILVMGDLNTAHRPIDLARPGTNKKTSGFLLSERREMGRWLRHGWTDTFRHVHGDVEGAYSWWSQRGDCRARNIGWRLDYVLASPGALALLRDAFILPEVTGSDHCPVGVDMTLQGA